MNNIFMGNFLTMTKEEFLDRIKDNKEVYNRILIDSIPEKVSTKTRVMLKCPIHGKFHVPAWNYLYRPPACPCRECYYEQMRRNAAKEMQFKLDLKYDSKIRIAEPEKYNNNEEYIDYICMEHGFFRTTGMWLLDSNADCPKCLKDKMVRNIFEEGMKKIRETHGDRYDYSKTKFKSVVDIATITCRKHGDFRQKVINHYRGDNCPKCVRENDKLDTIEFIRRARELYGNRYDYSKAIYTRWCDDITIICPKHGEFIQRAGSHLSGNKCKQCHLEDCVTDVDEVIHNARMVHGDTYEYDASSYRKTKLPMRIKCKKHGWFKMTPFQHISARGKCKKCTESYGEKIIRMCLDQWGIPYRQEYRIKNQQRLDFYLPENRLAIEFNGLQHYKPVKTFGGMETLLRNRERDKTKKKTLKEMGVKLIILNYLDLEKKRLITELSRKLSKIYPYWIKTNKGKTIGVSEIDRNISHDKVIEGKDLAALVSFKPI